MDGGGGWAGALCASSLCLGLQKVDGADFYPLLLNASKLNPVSRLAFSPLTFLSLAFFLTRFESGTKSGRRAQDAKTPNPPTHTHAHTHAHTHTHNIVSINCFVSTVWIVTLLGSPSQLSCVLAHVTRVDSPTKDVQCNASQLFD
ncbi:hypothetical protein LZ31DRAFT_305961 [Colletotrichum somersetense]|nr:hypothetical protein LZ31DRAFT_305961 [Colletotrichum somersetense]